MQSNDEELVCRLLDGLKKYEEKGMAVSSFKESGAIEYL